MIEKVAYININNYDISNVKEALKELFISLGYDKNNPLGHIIEPGMNVFIKPNWVASKWRESCPHKGDIYSVITHPAVVECVADFVAIALKGQGKITIGDNPSIDADFKELLQTTGIEKLIKKYSVPCEILDLRPLVCKNLKYYGDKNKMSKQTGDPKGYVEINLEEKSMFADINSLLFRGVFKQRKETIESHRKKKQLYSFARSIYDADAYISLPKMKTHHKAGVTLNLKGLVGTIGIKNQLVHWRMGFPFAGGDEYPDFISWLKGTFFSKIKSRGSWDGNDTIWRMVVDLYNAFTIKERKYFSVVDGIVAGEGDGPFCPTKKSASVLISGENMIAVDAVTSRLMGFNIYEIPYIKYLINNTTLLQNVIVFSNREEQKYFFHTNDKYLNFVPPSNWKNLLIIKD